MDGKKHGLKKKADTELCWIWLIYCSFFNYFIFVYGRCFFLKKYPVRFSEKYIPPVFWKEKKMRLHFREPNLELHIQSLISSQTRLHEIAITVNGEVKRKHGAVFTTVIKDN